MRDNLITTDPNATEETFLEPAWCVKCSNTRIGGGGIIRPEAAWRKPFLSYGRHSRKWAVECSCFKRHWPVRVGTKAETIAKWTKWQTDLLAKADPDEISDGFRAAQARILNIIDV